MSTEETMKILERKIEDLSKQLGATQKLISDLTEFLANFTSHTAQWIEERRKEAEKKGEKRQFYFYTRGLVIGLIFGVIGNLFVSYLMKAVEILNIPDYGWVLVTIGALAGMLILIWLFERETKKILKEGLT